MMSETITETMTETPPVEMSTLDKDMTVFSLYIVQLKGSDDLQVFKSKLSFPELQTLWADATWFAFEDGLVRVEDVVLIRSFYAPIYENLAAASLANDSWHAYLALRASLNHLDTFDEDFESGSDDGQSDVGYRSKV
jgi:hypothetical protein